MFAEAVSLCDNDVEVASWVEQNCPKSVQMKACFNDALRHRRPENDEEREWFAEQQRRLGRTDYLTYFDNLDVDEERF